MNIHANRVECASPTSRYLAGPTTSEDAAMNGTDREHVLARFWAKVNKTDGCWLWTASTNRQGYGRFQVGTGRGMPAHRFAYEVCVGPIPMGLTIDHVKARGCTSKACVNPAHLEAVPNVENVMRGDGACAKKARQTHCKNGHPLSGGNLTHNSATGGRICVTCRRAYAAEWARRHRTSARGKRIVEAEYGVRVVELATPEDANHIPREPKS